MCHNQIFHQQLQQAGDTEYDTNNAPKPMDIATDSTTDTARAPSPGFEEYQSTATVSVPTRTSSVKRKPASADMSIRPKRPRHESEGASGPDDAPETLKTQTSTTEPRPTQAMSRTTSTHRSSQSCKGRPRAHSLPPRLGRMDWVSHQVVDRQSQHVPPVNLKTLRELELSEFYRNPKLRHDVVFDSQLHFRPNNDGTRGLKKRVDSHGYWKLVSVECEVLLNLAKSKGAAPQPQGRPMKIPILLATMRDILLTLVPRADREEVESSLDPDLLMQQLEHGILDLKRMSLWLARIFKAHCAPMRDQWVDLMVSQFSRGVDRGDTRALMEGWKSIFGILEAMKLVSPTIPTMTR